VVDPDEKSYKTIESALGDQHRVLFVPNGRTAFDIPETQPVDIIYISQPLNGLDGFNLLASFKKRFRSIPVIIIAERPNVDDVLTAFRCGARDVMVKPLAEKELVEITKKISMLIPNKKSKMKRLSANRKKVRSTSNRRGQGNGAGSIRSFFRIFKRNGHHSGVELDEFKIKDDTPDGEITTNELIADTALSSQPSDKKTNRTQQEKQSHPRIQAFFLGSFRVLVNNQPIEKWPSKKGKSVFAYILLNHKKKILRDVLMDIFWQKSSPDSARNSLNVAIHGIRRELEHIDPKNDFILFKDECYYFSQEVDISLDVEEFRKTWQSAQSIERNAGLLSAVTKYRRAAGIYKGEFLEDEIYDSWSSLDRENLKEIYIVILDKISENLMNNGNHREAIRTCEKILEKDNCREDIYRRLMLCYSLLEQRDKALKIYRKCYKVLKNELEVKKMN
jgi:two-component SAPR family response regulator